jgi:hypothetical protein
MYIEKLEEKRDKIIESVHWNLSEDREILLNQSLANCTQLNWQVERSRSTGQELPQKISTLAENYGGAGTMYYLENDPHAKYFRKFDPWWPNDIKIEFLTKIGGMRGKRMFAFSLGSQVWIAKPIRDVYSERLPVPLPNWETINLINRDIKHNFSIPGEIQFIVNDNFPKYEIICETPSFIYTDNHNNSICIYPYYGFLERVTLEEDPELSELEDKIMQSLCNNGYNIQELCLAKSKGQVYWDNGKMTVNPKEVDDTLYLIDFECVMKLR